MLRLAMWPTSLFLDAGARTPIWAAVLGGAGIGLAWGIVARMFMSLIAGDHSDFTVPGTTVILAIFTNAGAFAGLAFGARRRGWRSWRVYVPRALAAVAIVPLGIAAGGPLLLISLLAALGVTRNEWPRTVRGVLLVVALGVLIASTVLLVADQTPTNQEALVVPLVAWIFYGDLLALRVGLEPASHAAVPEAPGQPSVIVGASPTTG